MGLAVLAAAALMGGCGISREAQIRRDDWQGRAVLAARSAEEGKAPEAAGLLLGLWDELAVSPQPEGGIPSGALVEVTSAALRGPGVGPVLEPGLRERLVGLEAKVVSGAADDHGAEVWHDLVWVLRDTPSMARVALAGRENRAVVRPLLKPKARRELLQWALRRGGHDSEAEVFDLTDGEAFAEGVEGVLWFGSRLTPGLLATY